MRASAAGGPARLATAAAVSAGYGLLAAWTYRSAVGSIASRYFADAGDGAAFLWNYWAVPATLPGLRTDLMFHPVGADLAFHTATPLVATVIAVVRLVLPDPVATNAVLLLSVALSGVCTYFLARHERAQPPLAFAAGAAFVLLPWRYGRMFTHHNLLHSFLLPLGLLALLRLLARPTRGRGAAYGAVVGAALWTDFTYFLFLLLSSAIVLGCSHRAVRARAFGASLGVGVAVAAALGSPVVIASARALVGGELDPLAGWGGADVGSLDLLAYVTPPPSHAAGASFASTNAEILGPERLGYVGVTVLAAAAIGAVGLRRAGRRAGAGAGGAGAHLLVLTAAFGVLALGPFLRVNGWSGDRFELYGVGFSVPLPYLVLHYVPVLNGLRVPARFSVVAALGLAVVAAAGIGRLADRWRFGPLAAGAVLLVAFVGDLQPDLAYAPLLDPDVPDAYRAIATAPGDGAVLDLPLQWRDGFGGLGGAGGDQSLLLYYATAHGKPVANGMVARLPADRLNALLGIDAYRGVLALQGDLPEDPAAASLLTAQSLRDAGIRWVVHHRDRPVPAAVAHIQTLGLRTVADDGTTVVLEIPPRSGG